MQFSHEILPGTWHVQLRRLDDVRGSFVKTFSRSVFEAHGASIDLLEEFYSTSHRHVIRGMHFQLPPHDHMKVVYCAVGTVADVLLDLRKGSGYGRVAQVQLSADEPSLVFIPRGVAHGFCSLSDFSLMVYKTSTEHAPSADAGVLWNSFGHTWPCQTPILSERDQRHPALADFDSPF